MTKVLVHGAVNGALRVAQGGIFLQGFAIGAIGEFGEVTMREAGLYSVGGDEGKFMRSSISDALGGTASVLTGGKFADGAVSAAFAHLFNAEQHGSVGCRTIDDAAADALELANKISSSTGLESGGLIYRNAETGDYWFTGPILGLGTEIDLSTVRLTGPAAEGQQLVGDYHTHPWAMQITQDGTIQDFFQDGYSARDWLGVTTLGSYSRLRRLSCYSKWFF